MKHSVTLTKTDIDVRLGNSDSITEIVLQTRQF